MTDAILTLIFGWGSVAVIIAMLVYPDTFANGAGMK